MRHAQVGKLAIIPRMGFPTWTLIGMGVTFVLALMMVLLAYLAMTPGSLSRFGLGRLRLERRVKALTGYGLALMMLALGFFLAGVPLDGFSGSESANNGVDVVAESSGGAQSGMVIPTSTPGTPGAETAVTPDSTNESEETEAEEMDADTEDVDAEEAAGGSGSGAFAPLEDEPDATATPTLTPTPSPTPTPVPTLTPTPIDGETAVIDVGGSVIWLFRAPGGQQLIPLQDQEIVIIYPGRANRSGLIWQQVAAGDGTVGWVEEQFLSFDSEEE